ncbi:hypothetical protein SAMN04487792_1626 [Lactobacillus bombicola]|uniref:Uncharacterized protein n=1 Tax=Lactobacillus bombicola TaxID=1505723 RepID=A0A1I1TY59_9LACO|nr:DUF5592 family protein [Lactobacillus bombicola]SFD62228.1 hypothetical protein SAMN04487792_1626 [Lactobacillus bombicola]
MDKYQNILIPKSTNVAIKMFLIDMLDLLFLFIGGMAGNQLSFMFNLQAIWQMILSGYGVIIAILLIMRTSLAPKMRNYRVLLAILRQDENKYYPLFLEGSNNENKNQ